MWKLLKAIYGLRSSPKAWQKHLSEVLQQIGLHRSTAEPNIYMTTTRNCFVLAYVDDLLFLGEEETVNKIFKAIQQQLLLRPTGTPSPGNTVAFLGRNITNRGDHYEISLSDEYVTTLLTETKLQDSKPASTLHIGFESSNSRPRSSSFNRRTFTIQTSSREASMDDLHKTRHQLCNKGASKSTAATNNSRSTKAQAPSQIHQRNQRLQTDHSTNGEDSSKGNSRHQRLRG